MSSVSGEEGARRLGAFGAELTADETAESFARAMLERAVRNAAGRPSPQAPMSASGLELRGKTIAGDAGSMVSSSGRLVPLGEVLFGSEFGSTEFRQFGGARSSRGMWLFAAADDPATIEQVERERVDQLLDEVAT